MTAELRPLDVVVVVTATAAWGYGIHLFWQRRLLSRLLGLDRGTISRR
jgi:hypothetical protein